MQESFNILVNARIFRGTGGGGGGGVAAPKNKIAMFTQ
jgi:hypothetical protein